MRTIKDVVAGFFKKVFLPVYLLKRYHYAIAFFLILIFSYKKGFSPGTTLSSLRWNWHNKC